MHRTMTGGNGKTPNAVASGLGLAFLLEETGEERYRQKCARIYAQYMQIRRTPEGGVSHLPISLGTVGRYRVHGRPVPHGHVQGNGR
jgi:rhamnogalacturonyl hydrolase YesR